MSSTNPMPKHPEDVKTDANKLEPEGTKKWLAQHAKHLKYLKQVKKDKLQEGEGGGTAISNHADATGALKRAELLKKSAELRIKQAKEREAIAKQRQALRKEDVDMLEEGFSDSQIAKLKQEYSKISTIDPSSDTYKKLIATLDKQDKSTLERLANAQIKFISGLAKNRVNRMKMKNEDVDKMAKASYMAKLVDPGDLEDVGPEEVGPKGVKAGAGKRKADKLDNKQKVAEDKKMKGDDPCWDDHEMVGTKKKNGKEVPNCVPKNEEIPDNPELSKKFNKAHKALGVIAKIKMKTIGQTSMNEQKYDIYHKDFSSAVQHAWKQAEKRGYEIDKDDWDRKIAMGPRKPGEGKTNTYSIGLTKAGKPQKKALQIQVYNKGGTNPYELNMYIEETGILTRLKHLIAEKKSCKKEEKEQKVTNDGKNEAPSKDKQKNLKKGEALSGKQEPITLSPEIDNNK